MIENKNIHKLPAGANEGYFRLPNSIFEINLSPDAFYLYAWLQSKPDDWEIADARTLAKKIAVMGRDRLYKAMLELENAMLLVRGKVRNKSGKIVKYIRELHHSPLPEKPASGPLPENPELVVDFGNLKKPVKTKASHVTKKAKPLPDIPDPVNQDIYKEIDNKKRKEINTTTEVVGLNGSTHPMTASLANWIWDQTGKNFYGDNPTPDRETHQLALNTITTFSRTYGAEAVKRAYAEMIAREATGDLIGKPVRLFKGICERQATAASNKKSSDLETIRKIVGDY